MISSWFKRNEVARIGSSCSRHESSSDDGPIACSDLWDLILDMDWDRVKTHCRQCPRDAAFLDGHWHETPLYFACQMSGPADAIRAIVQAYPEAVLIPSRSNHDLPLHIACRYQASVEVLEVLLQDFPVTSVEQTRWGKTPLMTLWEFRKEEMSEIEVEELWQKAHMLLSAVARFRCDPRYRNQQPTTRTREFRLPNSYSIDNNDRKTLTDRELQSDSFASNTSTRDVVGDQQHLFLVHAAVSLGSLSCPSEVLRHVLQLYPEQAKARDSWGLLPLHISVGPTPWSLATRRKYRPREQRVLQLLLQSHPEAASERLRGDQNRFPLHSAIANRHTWKGGVQELFRAAPHVMLIQDPVTNLYPFQLAAIPVRDTVVELDTVYELLRSQPAVLTLFNIPGKAARTWQEDDFATSGPIGASHKIGGFAGRCPAMLDNALFGTMSAVLIGGAAGLMFTD